ncbi:hypothetical protein [Pseudomonas sp. NPDC099000]|uniref:hypothetical protein n=1 Tax=Pseudomonas sp. NPDC099000 TaxID=3364488 RepID=UPI00383BCD56
MSQLTESLSDVGTLNAKIHNNFPFPDYTGTVTHYFIGPRHFYLFTSQKLSETETNEFNLAISPNIEAGRYELPNKEMIPTVPYFLKHWVDEHGAEQTERYNPDENNGYIVVKKIDKTLGIFEAEFNITLLTQGTPGKSHQAVGDINVTGWSENRK